MTLKERLQRQGRIRAAQDSYLFRAGWTSLGMMRMRCDSCAAVVRFGREQDFHRCGDTLTSR